MLASIAQTPIEHLSGSKQNIWRCVYHLLTREQEVMALYCKRAIWATQTGMIAIFFLFVSLQICLQQLVLQQLIAWVNSKCLYIATLPSQISSNLSHCWDIECFGFACTCPSSNDQAAIIICTCF